MPRHSSRETGRATIFVLRKLCIPVTSTLIKQFPCDPIVSSLIEKYVTVDTQRAGGPVEKTWTGNL